MYPDVLAIDEDNQFDISQLEVGSEKLETLYDFVFNGTAPEHIPEVYHEIAIPARKL